MSTEAAVKRLLAARDYGRAAETLMLEYGPGVRGLFITVFRNQPDSAEDAFSLFAERLWVSLPDFRGGSLTAWVYRVARNAAISMSRERWRMRAERLETGVSEALMEEVRTRTAVRLERQSAGLASLRDELSLDEQTLLTLRLDEKLAWEEIAEIMSSEGDPVDTAAVRKRFERLKKRLGELARARGLIE